MDYRTVLKKSRKCRKTNTDIAPEQEKELVYFANDIILEAVKFLNYEKCSEMRFLCRRVNQLVQNNQSTMQAFEVKSVNMENIARFTISNSIVSFDEAIESADDVREWVQDHGYSCDDTTDVPLENVFAGMHLSGGNGLHVTIRAFFEDFTEKNMSLARGQTKRHCLSNGFYLRAWPPKLFNAEFNAEYKFYGPILSHFFRLLHHPAAYFRHVSMFAPMADKFCDEASENLIRCDQFTLKHLDSLTLQHSLNWLKDNVRAQSITLAFNFNDKISDSEFNSLVLEFLLDASICAKDCITLDWLHYTSKFVITFIEKYKTLEVTKAIPSILIKRCLSTVRQYLESNLVPQDDPSVVEKYCDKCNVKTYKLQNKLDANRKMIVLFGFCVKHDCSYYGSMFRLRFE